MNIFGVISMDGLKELKENGWGKLKITLKNLIVKPREHTGDEELKELVKKREEIQREIKKLNQEKKRIEKRIHRARKAAKDKREEITEFPWREEIFPPLPEKTDIKSPESLALENNTLHAKNSEYLEDKRSGENKQIGMNKQSGEDKQSGMEIEIKGVNENKRANKKPEDHMPIEKISEDVAPTTIHTITANNVEEADSKNKIGQNDIEKTIEKTFLEKTFLEKEEKTKAVYPFSAGKLNEKRTSTDNNSIKKKETENKNNPAASLLGENLIEEFLNSEDLLPEEEEQSFMKYLQEQGTGELIKELKDIKYLLSTEQMC